jgi:hypothetical protein
MQPVVKVAQDCTLTVRLINSVLQESPLHVLTCCCWLGCCVCCCLQLAQVQCLFVSKMLESSSFNKLLSGVRECNRMLLAAARNGSRQYGPTLKVGSSRKQGVSSKSGSMCPCSSPGDCVDCVARAPTE